MLIIPAKPMLRSEKPSLRMITGSAFVAKCPGDKLCRVKARKGDKIFFLFSIKTFRQKIRRLFG
ncbi:MAG: hypothetical protein LRY50_05230, partial [Geovibrio sp.]|nr:hypothetical protein [Geovibrio sp.]